MNRRLLTALGASTLLVAALMPVAAGAASPNRAGAHRFSEDGIYIVQLSELPVVAYDGSINGPQGDEARGRPEGRTRRAPRSSSTSGSPRRPARRRAEGGRCAARSSTTTRSASTAFAARLTAAAGEQAGGRQGRPRDHAGRGPRGRHLVDAVVPRPDRRRAACGISSVASAARARTSSSASSTPASGPSRSASPTASTRTARRAPIPARSWPTSRSPAGTASACPVRTSPRPTATRS